MIKSYNIELIKNLKKNRNSSKETFWALINNKWKRVGKQYFLELQAKGISLFLIEAIAENKTQCLGLTKKGIRCSRLVTDSYCFQHKPPITFIDLFSGIGSFHYALKQIVPNAKCVLASDIDKNCNLTYYKNFGIKPELDILDLDFKKIPNADILFAGFPCQTFSLMGKKTGLSEAVFPLFEKLLNILKFKKIGCFVFENVRNLISMNNGAVFSRMIANFEDLGYSIYWKLLNCKDFGIPQSRQRVFIVGLHQSKYKNLNYEFPKPFLSRETLSSFFNKKFQRDYAHTIRCGGRGSKITSSYNWSNYYLEDGSVYALSIDDCKRLQNFSKDFILSGSKTSQWRQLGNTIPTNLSFCIVKNLIPLIKNVKTLL